MTPAEQFIRRLEELKEGERSLLRSLAEQPLDANILGFDLFTGLWWPLRAQSPRAPRRETSWLVAKLWGAFRIPHIRPDAGSGPSFANVLGSCEPSDEHNWKRFRLRFDALLSSPFDTLETHLRWALGEIGKAVAGQLPHARHIKGIDWVRFLDELSLWDYGNNRRDIREEWAKDYLKSVKH